MKNLNQKGVTLIALVIMIIVLLILASVATYSGREVIESSKLTTFTTEMKIMQTNVNELYEKLKNEEIKQEEIGKSINENTEVQSQANKVLVDTLEIENIENYRYIDEETLNNLKIEGLKQEFFINIEERRVVSYEGLKYKGDMYYTLEQLPDSVYNVEYSPDEGTPTFEVTSKQIESNKWKITISNIKYEGNINKWYVKYQKEGNDYWSTTEDLTFTVDESGVYTVILFNNNIEGENSIKIEKADGSYSEEKKVNTPKIDPEKGMQLVRYDEESETWKKDETNLEYSYEEQTGTTENGGTSKWANAKVTIDGVESYFVWIPRYAYKIDSTNKTIDVKFIKGTGTEATDGTICKYADDPKLNTATDYIIHPAFTTNADLGGGWSTELPGLWIGKYESARSDATSSNDGTQTTIKVQPGVRSFRNATIGDMYNYGINYSTNLQSHILKNSEWGAVAYLTHSKYGRNGNEIAINNSSEFITGKSGGSPNATSSNQNYDYNTEQGVLASSTGNIYGIYDLSGGAHECVASYYINGSLNNGTSFTSKKLSNRYSTVYNGIDINTEYIYGDATFETKSWNEDSGEYFISVNSSFFKRGGSYENESEGGIFCFYRDTGESLSASSFRLCLAI